jgi:hypothetical protein
MATPAQKWTGFSGKTLWDWLNLLGTLAIPLVVVLATIGFGWWQAHLADLQHQQDQQSALDQQRAAILQTYIDNIQDLLLNHNLLGDSPQPKNDADKVTIQETQELAHARTLTALQGLDLQRKGALLQFLHEAQLIGAVDPKTGKVVARIIDLSFADLRGANLRGADLSGAHYSRTCLKECWPKNTSEKEMVQVIRAMERGIGGWQPSVRGGQWSDAPCDQERIHSGAHGYGDRPSSRPDRGCDRCSNVPVVRRSGTS